MLQCATSNFEWVSLITNSFEVFPFNCLTSWTLPIPYWVFWSLLLLLSRVLPKPSIWEIHVVLCSLVNTGNSFLKTLYIYTKDHLKRPPISEPCFVSSLFKSIHFVSEYTTTHTGIYIRTIFANHMVESEMKQTT